MALKRKAKEDIEGLVSRQIVPCKICGHKFGEDPTFCLECDDKELNGNFEWEGIGQAIDEQSTVDAVEVVRCKDCKRRESGGFGQPNILCSQMHDDDYCSYGERRANGTVCC